MKTYVVPDIHGCAALFNRAIEIIERDKDGGTVVFLGDYVDRGPDSRSVLSRLMSGPSDQKWKWVCLRGNHEDMMTAAIRGQAELGWWIGNGGAATLASFPDGEIPAAILEWCDGLPLYHQDEHRIYVHAGVDPTKPMSEQTEAMLLWSRLGKRVDIGHPDGYVVHGHTPFDDGPIILQNRANMDAGAVFVGRLCVAVFDDDKPGKPVDIWEFRGGAS